VGHGEPDIDLGQHIDHHGIGVEKFGRPVTQLFKPGGCLLSGSEGFEVQRSDRKRSIVNACGQRKGRSTEKNPIVFGPDDLAATGKVCPGPAGPQPRDPIPRSGSHRIEHLDVEVQRRGRCADLVGISKSEEGVREFGDQRNAGVEERVPAHIRRSVDPDERNLVARHQGSGRERNDQQTERPLHEALHCSVSFQRRGGIGYPCPVKGYQKLLT